MGSSIISKPKLDYTESINKAIDPKSKQAVMGRFELYPIWMTKVKGNAAFSEGLVESLLARHHSHRKLSDRAMEPVQRKCAAIFLVDRIRFQGYKFERWIYYREILQYYRYNPSSSYFVLFVVDRNTYRRSYHSFECVYSEDANRMDDFMEQIMKDPQRMIETDARSPKALVNESLINPHWMYRTPEMYASDLYQDGEDDVYTPPESDLTLDSSHTYEGSSDVTPEEPAARATDRTIPHGSSLLQTSRYYSTDEVQNLPVARKLMIVR